jgi:hypothetical protein
MSDEDVHIPRKRMHPAWWLLSICIPCGISSYASYRTAKAEADAKASAGYVTLVASQEKLEKAFAEHLIADGRHAAELDAKVSVMKDIMQQMLRQQHPSRPRTALERTLGSGIAHVEIDTDTQVFPLYKAKPLPPTLDAAQQAVQAKK